jgi:molybdopterin synthase sulfur carrier subunit
MTVTFRIPTPLRPLTKDRDEVEAAGATVKEAIDDLEAKYPGLKDRLLDDKGKLRRYINVFHNDEDVRFAQALETPLKDGDKLAIVPAIAGG